METDLRNELIAVLEGFAWKLRHSSRLETPETLASARKQLDGVADEYENIVDLEAHAALAAAEEKK